MVKRIRAMNTIRQIAIACVFALGLIVGFTAFGWIYTSSQLARASAKGVYPSAEEGMLALTDRSYAPDKQVKILYAGTNSFNGSNPFIWYVIAEVRASSRADGSELSHNGCDSPGSYFLQTKEGWIPVGEGQFPEFMGFWMNVFHWAGEGDDSHTSAWEWEQNSELCK
jgi:hypothetical protein